MHNHARMWFASIWIFTLRLALVPRGGLLHASPSGRRPGEQLAVVALGGGAAHPRQHYVARAENIRRYTEGPLRSRRPRRVPDALDETMPPREVALLPADAPPSGDVALLLHLDDLHPESLPRAARRSCASAA